jgi:hypothetical protein
MFVARTAGASAVDPKPAFSCNLPDCLAVVAEWLRRRIRNPLGSARAGSNPADCEYLFCIFFGASYLFDFLTDTPVNPNLHLIFLSRLEQIALIDHLDSSLLQQNDTRFSC